MTPQLKQALSQGGFCLATEYLNTTTDIKTARAELAELAKKGIIRFSKTVNGKNLIIKNDTYPKQPSRCTNITPHKTTPTTKRRTT